MMSVNNWPFGKYGSSRAYLPFIRGLWSAQAQSERIEFCMIFCILLHEKAHEFWFAVY